MQVVMQHFLTDKWVDKWDSKRDECERKENNAIMKDKRRRSVLKRWMNE